MVIDRIDSTVVNVAAPSIQASLGGGYTGLQWMAAAYTLAMAVCLLIGGRLGDMFGRKFMLLLGVVGFTGASIACAVSWTPGMLIGSRALQGMFSAMMLPQVFALIRDIFPREEQRKAWTVLGPVIGLATVMGPVMGGALIALDLFGTGWRMIFLVNLPIGIAVVWVGHRLIPRKPPPIASRRLDWLGVLLAGSGMFLLVSPLVRGHAAAWPWYAKLMLVGALPILALFGWHQWWRKRKGRNPLIEPEPFRTRSFVSGIVFALSFLIAVGGFVLSFSVFTQLGLAFSPLKASLTALPWAIGAFAGSMVSAALMVRLGRHIIHIGLAIMFAGLVSLAVVIQTAGAGLTAWHFSLPLLVGGTGMGMVFVPMFDIILGGLANHEVGSGSAVLKAVQQLGMALGVAVIGTVFFSLTASGDFLLAARNTSFVAAGMIAVAFLVGFWLPRRPVQQGG
jgi:EmrB/QacA subfamily drug resistance transporter